MAKMRNKNSKFKKSDFGGFHWEKHLKSPAGFANYRNWSFSSHKICAAIICLQMYPNCLLWHTLSGTWTPWVSLIPHKLSMPIQVLLLTMLRPQRADSLPAASPTHPLPPSTPGLWHSQYVLITNSNNPAAVDWWSWFSARFDLQPIDDTCFL